MTENVEKLEIYNNFNKIINDFINDLIRTFPDKITKDSNENIYNYIEENDLSEIESMYEFCKKIYPKHFFNILYENEEIFQNQDSVELLPGVNFLELWNQDISDKTKSVIWKYLQLILFSIVNNLESEDSFGDAAKLFEAINQDEFKNKIEDTIAQMTNIFSKEYYTDNDDNHDTDDNNDKNDKNDNNDKNDDNDDWKMPNLPNADELHSHINEMMQGKLGSLAQEIAEETAADLDINMDNIKSVDDVFKQLFKNPSKLMGLVQNVGSKLDNKIKSGNIKESELLEEASDLVNKMKNMPGMNNFESMFSKMGMPGMGKGAKFDMNAFSKQMEQNMRGATTRDRMRTKLQKKENITKTISNCDNNNSDDAKKSVLNIDEMNRVVYSTGDNIERSSKSSNKKKKKARGKKK